MLTALIALAATSEGFISRDLMTALAAALSAAAIAISLLAMRESRTMRRSAQDYFARIENAARRFERGRLEAESSGAETQAYPVRNAQSAPTAVDPVAAPRLAQGIRPTVIEGGKAKAERLNAEMSAADDALLVAINAHSVPVSLEPVVELKSSRVAAYRVHAHIRTADGHGVNLRRLQGGHPGIDAARFDIELFNAAAAAARRFPGASTEDTPLICPLGSAALSSPKDMRKIVGMLNSVPGLKQSLVLEVPAEALVAGSAMFSGAALLADAAARLAVEGVPNAQSHKQAAVQLAGRNDIEFWTVASLSALEMRRDLIALISDGEGKCIASGLSHDHEVVAAIDADVTLACGPRFSDPMPVKLPGGAASSDQDRAGGIS